MTINERVRHLRKHILRLTQEEFACKLKVSTSNIGSVEIGRTRLTERLLADVCREWSVNARWLTSGEEPVFLANMDPCVHKIVDIYKSLNSDSKKYLKGYIDRLLEEQNGAEGRPDWTEAPESSADPYLPKERA
jgi:transcriptional regulator with XRE-family HTH domain